MIAGVPGVRIRFVGNQTAVGIISQCRAVESGHFVIGVESIPAPSGRQSSCRQRPALCDDVARGVIGSGQLELVSNAASRLVGPLRDGQTRLILAILDDAVWCDVKKDRDARLGPQII